MSDSAKLDSVYEGRFNLFAVQTPGQTLGPFFHQGLMNDKRQLWGNDLRGGGAKGQPITLQGRVLDGLNRPVTDALLEIWQADAEGVYPHPLDNKSSGSQREKFVGFGRAATNATGAFEFHTLKPGLVPNAGRPCQAAHLHLIIGARGMMRHAFTRVYFAGDNELEEDPVLQRIAKERRDTLLARKVLAKGAGSALCYQFHVHLQGPLETVFFRV